jgi:hypothetical protein
VVEVVVLAAPVVEVVVVAACVVDVVVVGGEVVAVEDVVVVLGSVVVGGGQLPPSHASQQLETEPAHAVPPFGARQYAALRLMLQRVLPRASVRQHATDPGLPHVELPAHSRNFWRHGPRRSPFRTARFATRATQLT